MNNTSDSLIDGELIERFTRIFEEKKVAGLAVSVVQGVETPGAALEWKQQITCWGRRGPKGDPVDEDSIFAIGSISKFHAVLCVGILIDRGCKIPNGSALSWKTKVQEILPWWGLQPFREGAEDYGPDESGTITLMDLASMRTGVPIHLAARGEVDVETALRRQRYLRPCCRPREVVHYNNEAIYALGHIVTVLSGTPYPDFLQQELFDALGMSSSTLHSDKVKASGKATDGHARRLVSAEDGSYTEGPPEALGWWTDSNGEWLYSGGISSSPADGARIARELLDPQVLPKSAVDFMFSPGTLIPPGDLVMAGLGGEGRAYGGGMVHAVHRSGYKIKTHSGGQRGHTTLFALVPELKFGIWAYVNERSATGGRCLSALFSAILDLAVGVKDKDHFGMLSTPPPAPPPIQFPELTIKSQAVPPDQLAGMYFDKAYREFLIEPYNDTPEPVKRAMELALKGANRSNDLAKTHFIINLDNMFISKVILEHIDGLVYRWTALLVLDTVDAGESNDPIASLMGAGGRAVFVTGPNAGLGMFDGWWELVGSSKIKATEIDVQSSAETWFDKV